MKQRDIGLDLVKGLACAMMIFPHVSASGGAWVDAMRYWGAFAPVLFYAVTGVTTEFQLKKRTALGLVLAYGALAILGYLNTWIWHPGRWPAGIMQCIGLSVIALIGLRRLLDRKWLGLLFPVPFLLHWIVMAIGWQAPYPLSPLLVTPGQFALAPWLGFFMLGHWAYQARLQHVARIAALCAAAALGAWWGGFDVTHKFAMSPGYFAISCTLTLVMVLGIRGLPKLWPRLAGRGVLLYFGRHSLLFLFAHLFAGRVLLARWGLESYPALKWSAALLLTIAVMAGVLWLHDAVLVRWNLGERWVFWLALMVTGTAAAYSGHVALLYPPGFLFATNYLTLVRAVGRLQWPVATGGRRGFVERQVAMAPFSHSTPSRT